MARDTHAEVVKAAIRQFLAHGYRKCSLTDIALDAGVSKATLYNHFDGKEEIFSVAVERFAEGLVSQSEQAAAQDGPPEERVYAVLDAMHGALARALYRTPHALELVDERLRLTAVLVPMTLRYMAALSSVLAPHIDEPVEAAMLLMRCARGLGTSDTGGSLPTPEQYSRRLQEMSQVVFAGLVKVRGLGPTAAPASNGPQSVQ